MNNYKVTTSVIICYSSNKKLISTFIIVLMVPDLKLTLKMKPPNLASGYASPGLHIVKTFYKEPHLTALPTDSHIPDCNRIWFPTKGPPK